MSFEGKNNKKSISDYILVDNILVDSFNPRFRIELKGKTDQFDIISTMKRYFSLDELAISIASNGYLDEESIVVIPEELPLEFKGSSAEDLCKNEKYKLFIKSPSTKFIVVEGNRRVSTIKILLDDQLREQLSLKSWPSITEDVRQDITMLPAVIYPDRDTVIPYLGVRHIAGVLKWDAYAKASYIADMIKTKASLDDISAMIGNRKSDLIKSYLSYRLIELAEEEDIDTKNAKSSFSFIVLALGQANIKQYLGLPRQLSDVDLDEPISPENIDNFKRFFVWLYGDGKTKDSIIKDSREITNKLSDILKNREATKYLCETANLQEAYELSDGEEERVLGSLSKAISELKKAASNILLYKSEEIKERVEQCEILIQNMKKNLDS